MLILTEYTRDLSWSVKGGPKRRSGANKHVRRISNLVHVRVNDETVELLQFAHHAGQVLQ